MITVSYPSPQGRLKKELPFVPGQNVRYYLRAAGVIALRNRCALMNAAKERLSGAGTPRDGDVIMLVNTGRAMS